jgi:PleD family two-component response regulator
MLLLREEIQRERRGIMRSTDEFAVTHRRLLQDALTDALTQLPNRRHGLDFLASEWAFAQSNGAADGLPAARHRPLQAHQRQLRPCRR